MKPRELENIIKADGWKYTDAKGSHHISIHQNPEK
ncbi:type II toxin-antitoxin system HicA family toxin [Desulfosporosinus nitroreducens]